MNLWFPNSYRKILIGALAGIISGGFIIIIQKPNVGYVASTQIPKELIFISDNNYFSVLDHTLSRTMISMKRNSDGFQTNGWLFDKSTVTFYFYGNNRETAKSSLENMVSTVQKALREDITFMTTTRLKYVTQYNSVQNDLYLLDEIKLKVPFKMQKIAVVKNLDVFWRFIISTLIMTTVAGIALGIAVICFLRLRSLIQQRSQD